MPPTSFLPHCCQLNIHQGLVTKLERDLQQAWLAAVIDSCAIACSQNRAAPLGLCLFFLLLLWWLEHYLDGSVKDCFHILYTKIDSITLGKYIT